MEACIFGHAIRYRLIGIRHRYRQLCNIWADGGAREVLNRIRRVLAARIAPRNMPSPVRACDVLAANLDQPRPRSYMPLAPGQAMIINWVTTPPAFGSGGHTTMFRLIEHLERTGSTCRLYLYDVYGGDIAYFRMLVRQIFPRFRGSIDDVTDGMKDAHAVVATSWQAAYPVYSDTCQGRRFYLVQDFEPWFYAAGSQSTLAENTYRMGFHAITAGQFLAHKLRTEYAMSADAFNFGCDATRYHLLSPATVRDGIVFYARPDTPRRGFEIGIIALEIFAKRRPDITIHLYGSGALELPFPCINHGVLPPERLNLLYNRSFAGLSLSMTNVSLVPHEMLAAGCIPVVNDTIHNRMVLDNAFVRYVAPAPHILANALLEVCETKDFAALAVTASESVRELSWAEAGAVAERSIRSNVIPPPTQINESAA